MIPYIEIPAFHFPFGLYERFGLKLDIFGVVSAIGTFLGAYLAAQQAKKWRPGNDQPLKDVVTSAVVGGLLGGHFLHVFAYHPELLDQQGYAVIFRVWDGLSSMGGVLGALAGIFWFFRKNKIPLMPYVDALALGTAPGWAVARIGCFLVHDHPGLHTNFFLAVQYPGGPRHDLGLYDFFVLTAISGLLWTLKRSNPPTGMLMGLLATIYPVCRFSLDFLRASDTGFDDRRYFGLTPAQYIVLGLFAVGVKLLMGAKKEAGVKQEALTPSK
ncbi:MAG: prolipoprotein diacylglyceryl transferase [Myxococcaceae bacterium]